MKRFKQLLFRRRPERLEGILGSASRIVQPPLSMRPSALRKSKSQDTDNRQPLEGALTTEGVHRDVTVDHSRKFRTTQPITSLTVSRLPRRGIRYTTHAETVNHHPGKRSKLTQPY